MKMMNTDEKYDFSLHCLILYSFIICVHHLHLWIKFFN